MQKEDERRGCQEGSERSKPERRITFTNDYNKRTRPGHGSRFQSRLPNSDIQKHMAVAHQPALVGAMQSNPTWIRYDRPPPRNFNSERRPTNTRFGSGNQRFSQEGEDFFATILIILEAFRQDPSSKISF